MPWWLEQKTKKKQCKSPPLYDRLHLLQRLSTRLDNKDSSTTLEICLDRKPNRHPQCYQVEQKIIIIIKAMVAESFREV